MIDSRPGPTEATAERRAGAAGIAFAVLFVASVVVVPTPPSSGDSAAKIQHYFVEHAEGIRGSTYGLVVATVFYLALLAGLRSRIERAGAGVFAAIAFGAGLLLAGLSAIASITNLMLASQAGGMGEGVVRSFYGYATFYLPVATGVTFALAASVAIAALRNDALPRWAGLASVGLAAYLALESLTVYGTSGAFEPGGTINAIGVVVFMIWSVVVSVALLRDPGPVASVRSSGP